MSSILDSLKKLEKETAQQDLPLTHAGTAGRGVIPKYVIGFIGAVCIGIVAIGLAAYYKGTSTIPPEPLLRDMAPASKPTPSLDEQKKEPATSHDAPAPLPTELVSSSTAKATTDSDVKSNDNILPIKPVPAAEESSKPFDANKSEQLTESKEAPLREQAEDKPIAETTPQEIIAQEDSSDLQDKVTEKTLAKEKELVSIDRLEGVGFKIQAISWSDIPAQSLAVINNQVMREGGNIEGYQISRINPDDIILERDGKAYQLDFRSTGTP